MEIVSETLEVCNSQERIYKTSAALRKAVKKYSETHKKESNINYLLRRQDPEYVLKCQNSSRIYKARKKEEKLNQLLQESLKD